jgi:hypothetical protein
MGSPHRVLRVAVGFSALLCVAATQPTASRQGLPLGAATDIAPGVSLYHVTESSHLDPPAPISIWLLRVDPHRADIETALANDEILDTETVPDLAQRHGAVAAVNAGFFLLPSGDPSGVYKLNGQLVSDTRRVRGAVGIVRSDSGPQFLFGRVAASMTLKIPRRAKPDASVEIAGVDTTRQLNKLMLFTPAYHAHTDTAAGGLEWILEGTPLRVAGKPLSNGKTPIPKSGFVLSFGGSRAPAPLASLRQGTRVELETRYTPLDGRSDEWAAADDIVGGAGLLARDGVFVADWGPEKLASGFAVTRHPRTIIGTHPDGSVWLVTVDGRQPQLSAGMSLLEVRDFARRLGLANAVNLDGGGSTTMWVRDRVVNSPSDAAGPRKVSDALLVMEKKGTGTNSGKGDRHQ